MMLKEHYDFLKTQKHHFETVKDGWLQNVDQLPMLEHIYHLYIDRGFTATTWCKSCIVNMMIRLSRIFDNETINLS